MKCNIFGIFVLFLVLTVKSVDAAAQQAQMVLHLTDRLEVASLDNLRLMETIEMLHDRIEELQKRNALAEASTDVQGRLSRRALGAAPIVQAETGASETKDARIVGLKRELKQLKEYNQRWHEIYESEALKTQKIELMLDQHQLDFEDYVAELKAQLQEKDRQIAQVEIYRSKFLGVGESLHYVKNGLSLVMEVLEKKGLTRREAEKAALDLALLYSSIERTLGVITTEARVPVENVSFGSLKREKEVAQLPKRAVAQVVAPQAGQRRVSWGRSSAQEIESKNAGRKDFPKSKGRDVGRAKIFIPKKQLLP